MRLCSCLLGCLTVCLFRLFRFHHRRLDISSNALYDSVPSALTVMSWMKYVVPVLSISAGPCRLSHAAILQCWFEPLSFFFLYDSRFRVLSLGSNALSGSLSANITKLSQLQYLDLSSNMVQSSIPNLASLTGLTFLNLSANGLNGSLPASLTSMTSLVYVRHSVSAHTCELNVDVLRVIGVTIALQHAGFVEQSPDRPASCHDTTSKHVPWQ